MSSICLFCLCLILPRFFCCSAKKVDSFFYEPMQSFLIIDSKYGFEHSDNQQLANNEK